MGMVFNPSEVQPPSLNTYVTSFLIDLCLGVFIWKTDTATAPTSHVCVTQDNPSEPLST